MFEVFFFIGTFAGQAARCDVRWAPAAQGAGHVTGARLQSWDTGEQNANAR